MQRTSSCRLSRVCVISAISASLKALRTGLFEGHCSHPDQQRLLVCCSSRTFTAAIRKGVLAQSRGRCESMRSQLMHQLPISKSIGLRTVTPVLRSCLYSCGLDLFFCHRAVCIASLDNKRFAVATMFETKFPQHASIQHRAIQSR
jgi:hypothetical protein